jgi:biotin carboxyl carrier protein
MAEKKAMKKDKNIENPCDEKVKCKSLQINETKYRTQLTKKFENRKPWQAPDPKKVLSYLPGTILKVFVKKGQKVKEGDPVVILEAMKMRNKVNMPSAGVIKSVNVKTGENVPKGYVIVEME